MSIRFACQTYSWQMTIDAHRGKVEHLVDVVARAGFAGFEPEIVMLGDGWNADQLREVLDRHGVQLAALCLVADWEAPRESDAERAEADAVIAAVASIPGAIINLVTYPGTDRADLRLRQDAILSCVDAVSARAADAGVRTVFHANSPEGSVFRTRDDYSYLLDHLPGRIGFCPDLGHVARGGMDPLEIVRTYRDRVEHLHVKDMYADGRWAPSGEGIVDVPGVLRLLADTGYDGWIVLEDESSEAEADPDAAAARNGQYIREVLT